MPFFSESQALGTGSSPWTYAASDQLYPDNADYRVGIGTTTVPISSLVAASAVLQIGSTSKAAASLVLQDNEQKFEILNNGYLGFHCDNSEKMRLSADGKLGIGVTPDTLFHLRAADGTPKIKLEGTDYDYTIEVDANHSGSQASSLLRFESDTHFSTNQVELKNGTTNASSAVEFYLTSKGSSSIIFRDDDLTASGKTKSQFIVNYDTDRLYLYGEDGYAGGMFTMDFSPASDARFAFGYGDQALSNAARLAIKHTSSPQLLLDDGTSNTTFKHEDNSGAPRVTVSGGMNLTGVNNNLALRLSQADSGATYKFMEFKNDAATTESFAPYIYSDVVNGYTRVRFVGSGGGSNWVFDSALTCRGGLDFDGTSNNISTTGLNLRWHASTGFGMGAAAFTPSGAMLHIKDASNPQLKLDDGTQSATLKTSDEKLTVLHSDANWQFTIDATTNANLAFAKGGTIKSAIRHYGDTAEGLFGPSSGTWRNSITAVSAASATVTAPNGFGNVLACDTTSNAITATLPAVADYSGTVFYVIDSKGNAGATGRAITIAVQTGEKLDGVLNGTATISSNNGFSVLVCTADGWFQVA